MNNNIKILVDMDDTMTWLLPVWVNWLNKLYKLSVDWKQIKCWDMSLAFPQLTRNQIYEPLTTEVIWDDVIPRNGAVEVLTRLHNDGFDIYVVTATDYRNVKPKFERVIRKHFPFIDWEHIIIANHKQMIQANFIIDDAPQNLAGGCQNYKILIDMPHNMDFTETCGIIRLHNWEQIEQFIRYMSLPRY